jgi:butyrate kinase
MNKSAASREEPTLLVINPGSATTRLGVFCRGVKLWSDTIEHSDSELARFGSVAEQLDWREQTIERLLEDKEVELQSLDAVVGRGGLLRPVRGGTYEVTDAMCADLEAAKYGEHASNLGALLARRFAERLSLPAYVVDPVTTDEFDPAARLSGVPGIERKCRTHALNVKAVARRAAADLGKDLAETKFVVAHIGGGISVCALRSGRIVDSTDGLLGEGSFSPERAGTVSLAGMIDLCFESGRSREEIVALLSKGSGFKGYLGTTSLQEVYEMIDDGKTEAQLVLDAMVRQIVKWIGGMAAVLGSRPDAVILTGGMANSSRFVRELSSYVEPLASVKVYPGELEMEALAEGAMRVLQRTEEALEY